ncbi:MAG: hypothetical protein HGB01_08305 [Chlorobiaceae bacterium]|nr:hypothetical protein [Chlorobiaceae bacterium]
MSSVEQAKAELLSVWIKRFECLESGDCEDSYESIAENLIKRITRDNPDFSAFDFYNDNFEAYNPYMEISGR